jgi:hypothetical protein
MSSSEQKIYDGFQFVHAKHRARPVPPTALVAFKSDVSAAKDHSAAANIDADRALISFKEMPITPVTANHNLGEVARGEIFDLAVARAALIDDFECGQNPAPLDIVGFENFIWEPDFNRRN